MKHSRSVGAVWLLLLAGTVALGSADEAYRHRAPIVVQKEGPFVQVPLTPEAYGRSLQPGLADLRVVDARGERVGFALLQPRADQVQTVERTRPASLYPLPPKANADGTWAAPVELTVEGSRINVRQRPGLTMDTAGRTRSGGWLIDLGERSDSTPTPSALRFRWSGPAEFSAAFQADTSADLQRWLSCGSGQLMALASTDGALEQPRFVLPSFVSRFVRIVWTDPSTAPVITGTDIVSPELHAVAVDPPVEVVARYSPEPPSARPIDEGGPRALSFDLGGALPVTRIDLRWTAGTQIAPVHLEGRASADDGWHMLASTVFYRLDRNGAVSTSGPVDIGQTVRHVRVTPDPRAGRLDPARTQLLASVRLASLVFAAEGQAPYALEAGSTSADIGPLPIGTLIPDLEAERPRLGQASLGTWQEVEEVVRRAEAERQRTMLTRWLLWLVLVGGVAGLAFMVWRLARAPARE